GGRGAQSSRQLVVTARPGRASRCRRRGHRAVRHRRRPRARRLHAARHPQPGVVRARGGCHRGAAAVAMRSAPVTGFAALAVALSLTVAAASGAARAQTGSGELGSDYVRATASDLGSGTFAGPGVPARAPSTASLFTWTRQTGPLVCVFFTAP